MRLITRVGGHYPCFCTWWVTHHRYSMRQRALISLMLLFVAKYYRCTLLHGGGLVKIAMVWSYFATSRSIFLLMEFLSACRINFSSSSIIIHHQPTNMCVLMLIVQLPLLRNKIPSMRFRWKWITMISAYTSISRNCSYFAGCQLMAFLLIFCNLYDQGWKT